MKTKTTKKAFKKFMVHAGTYDFNIWFVISEDIERVMKFINFKLELPSADYLAVNYSDFRNALGKHFQRDGYVPIIWMPVIASTPDQHGTLLMKYFILYVA